jgi:serine/threonine protein kinase
MMREIGTKVPMEDQSNLPAHRSFEFGGVKYVLGHQIARGGFSTVYKARDEWGNHLVAKVYNADVAPGMWQNEIEHYQRLRHPHIVRMYAGFELDDQGHIILEYSGIGMGRVTVRSDEERRLLLPLVAKGMLEALHFMHLGGFVHTDINPGNVLLLLSADNHPLAAKICDLGLTINASKLVCGRHTANWNPPPETLDDRFGELGASMDIYSAALVLMELLLGEELTRFSEEEILMGEPQRRALEVRGSLGVTLANALSPHAYKRVTAIELWRQIRIASVKPHF